MGQGRKRFFFLEKKKQKNFTRGFTVNQTTDSNGQKFFASFFQKRSAFLPISIT